jgi:ATP-binding cassette subfamily B protein
MQVGTLIAFLSYLMQILIAVMMATFMVAMIPRASVSGDRIAEVLATNTSVVLPEHPVTATDGSGRVEFRDVEFSFPLAEEPVLTEVSFIAHPGKTTAIIGSTGSGKSTLISLIPRLFDATAGSVIFNGVNVRELAPEVLWGDIGLIPQKPFLFRGTVRSNLQYGKPSATEEEMWRALTIAQAADFVRSMPDGLDSPIAQAGNNVSGGQRQRLAIARALIKEPAVYVFDDSFSALDLKTDAQLREALAKNIRGATVIMVAQRVSTIRDADQILVLEDGKIVARGTHESLLDSSETYREIVESQLSAEEVA